ncbi:MAG: helicase-associated domain-containing protein [Bacillota bacterium]
MSATSVRRNTNASGHAPVGRTRMAETPAGDAPVGRTRMGEAPADHHGRTRPAPIQVRGLDTFLPAAPALAECLAAAPPWYLDSLRARHGALGSLEDVLGSLLEPEHLAGVLGGLDSPEKTALWLVGALNAGRGIPVEQCWATLGEITGQRHRRFQPTFDSLRRKALVFVGHYDYRAVYFIPRDVRAAAEEIFFRPVIGEAALPEAAHRSRGHRPTAIRDLHLFLLAVTRGEIRLTRQGDIYRRQQMRLARLLGWPGWGPTDSGLPREDCLAARMSVLWDYALARHLIEDQPDGVAVTPVLQRWTGLSWAERWLDMVEQLIHRGANWYQNVFTLLQMLFWVPPGRWLPVHRALPVPGTGSLPAGLTAQPLTQWIHSLEFLGILEQAEGPDHKLTALRLTPLGRDYLEAVFGGAEAFLAELLPQDETSFIVAPNFEVVAPFTLHPRILLQVGTLADLIKADQALLFQINRSSVYQAMKAGMDGEALLAVLGKGSEHPLPQNVEASIREWAAAYGRVWLARFHLLRCADPETAAHLKASPRLQPYLAGELTPCDFILREGDLTVLSELLEKEGFLPRAQVEVAAPLDGGTSSTTHFATSLSATAPYKGQESMTTATMRGQRQGQISPGRAPTQPPIRVVASDWFDLPGRR